MNEKIIDNWNKVVKKFDKVFHLGDFCFGRHNIEIADRLNGQKRLILGNHDCYPVELYAEYFLSVHGAMYWNDCILTHVPVHPDMLLDDRAYFNIHGHMHSKKMTMLGEAICGVTFGTSYLVVDDPRYINVSCEQNNLTPINADVLLQRNKE